MLTFHGRQGFLDYSIFISLFIVVFNINWRIAKFHRSSDRCRRSWKRSNTVNSIDLWPEMIAPTFTR